MKYYQFNSVEISQNSSFFFCWISSQIPFNGKSLQLQIQKWFDMKLGWETRHNSCTTMTSETCDRDVMTLIYDVIIDFRIFTGFRDWKPDSGRIP